MRAYSRNQFAELDFDGKEYEFNEQEGTFTGTLVCKKWGKKSNIIAYVDFDDGRKIMTTAFAEPGNYFGIPEIPMGSIVKLTFASNKRHNVRLKSVEVIE
jgi:hypothetical protein